LLPLGASAVTGLLYKLGQEWMGFSEETSDLLMSIHEAWLGFKLRVYYVLLVGGGLLIMGLLVLSLLVSKKWRPPKSGLQQLSLRGENSRSSH
jgi:hypothetical protein